jgi:hypothetical protein
MQFHLPHLGEVKASVIIIGNQTQVKLLIGKDSGVTRLQESQQALINTLSAIGQDVSSIIIQKDE